MAWNPLRANGFSLALLILAAVVVIAFCALGSLFLIEVLHRITATVRYAGTDAG